MDGLQPGHPACPRRLIETTLISPPQFFAITQECSPLDPPARSIVESQVPERDVDATASLTGTVTFSARTRFDGLTPDFCTMAVRQAPRPRPAAVQEAT